MFLSLNELKHKRAYYVVLQGKVLQVTKCRRKNRKYSLSDDADEGCINRISLAAADQNGSLASFSFHHLIGSMPSAMPSALARYLGSSFFMFAIMAASFRKAIDVRTSTPFATGHSWVIWQGLKSRAALNISTWGPMTPITVLVKYSHPGRIAAMPYWWYCWATATFPPETSLDKAVRLGRLAPWMLFWIIRSYS